MPAARDQPEHRPEQPPEDTALRQQTIEVFLDEGTAAAHVLESAIDRQQNDEIGGGDEEQKNRRDQRANGAADELEAIEAALERAGSQRDDGGGEHDDGRMAKREEGAAVDRP